MNPGELLNEMLVLLDPAVTTEQIQTLCKCISTFDLKKCDKTNRVYIIDTAIKFGYIEVVKAVSELFKEAKLEDDIRVPSEVSEYGKSPFRPTFWLPSIVSRLPHRSASHYEEIERYLCTTFAIPEQVIINGKLQTKKEYCSAIDYWKHLENIRLFVEEGTKRTRHRRHIFINDVQQGVQLRSKEKKPCPRVSMATHLLIAQHWNVILKSSPPTYPNPLRKFSLHTPFPLFKERTAESKIPVVEVCRFPKRISSLKAPKTVKKSNTMVFGPAKKTS